MLTESKYKVKDEALFAEVQKLKEGSGGDYNRLYELSEKYIYKIINDIVKNHHTTEDLMQETYLQIYNKINTLQEPKTFYVWAGRIATNLTLRHIQKYRKEVLATADEEGNTDFVFEVATEDNECFIPESVLMDKEKQRLIAEILDNLSVEQKLSVQYFYYEEMSVRDIAQVMECSEGTVKSRLNYARKSIKDAVIDLEKKQGTKLYSLAALPLFWLLFRESAEAAALAGGSAVAGAVGAKGSIGAGTAEAKGSAVVETAEAKGSAVAGATEAQGSIVAGTVEAKGSAVARTAEAKGTTEVGVAEPKKKVAKKRKADKKALSKMAIGLMIIAVVVGTLVVVGILYENNDSRDKSSKEKKESKLYIFEESEEESKLHIFDEFEEESEKPIVEKNEEESKLPISEETEDKSDGTSQVTERKEEVQFSMSHVFLVTMRARIENGKLMYFQPYMLDEDGVYRQELQEGPVINEFELDTFFDKTYEEKTHETCTLSEDTYNLIYSLETKTRESVGLHIDTGTDIFWDPEDYSSLDISSEEKIKALLGENMFIIEVDGQRYAWKIYRVYAKSDSIRSNGETTYSIDTHFFGMVLRIPTDIEIP